MDEGKEILEGFNAGYLIEKHRPELAQQLVKSVDGVEVPFIEGFVAGSQEYVRERIQVKTIAKLREVSKGIIPKTAKNKGREIGDKSKGFEKEI